MGFPVPALALRTGCKGRRREKERKSEWSIRLTNLWILVLNWMHAENAWDHPNKAPTVAQSRVQNSLLTRARSFLRQSDHLAPDGEDIKTYLRAENTGYLSAARTALPLGERAGVPDSAAGVDTAAVLADFNPQLAEQCEEPEALLRGIETAVGSKVKPFSCLDRTYPALIQKAERAGLV